MLIKNNKNFVYIFINLFKADNTENKYNEPHILMIQPHQSSTACPPCFLYSLPSPTLSVSQQIPAVPQYLLQTLQYMSLKGNLKHICMHARALTHTHTFIIPNKMNNNTLILSIRNLFTIFAIASKMYFYSFFFKKTSG